MQPWQENLTVPHAWSGVDSLPLKAVSEEYEEIHLLSVSYAALC